MCVLAAFFQVDFRCAPPQNTVPSVVDRLFWSAWRLVLVFGTAFGYGSGNSRVQDTGGCRFALGGAEHRGRRGFATGMAVGVAWAPDGSLP